MDVLFGSVDNERPWLLDGARTDRKRKRAGGKGVCERVVDVCPIIEEVDGIAGTTPVLPAPMPASPLPPPAHDKKETIAHVYLETNRVFLHFLLMFLFSKDSIFRDQVYKKWMSMISSASEERRDKDLVRILTKMSSCKGRLEIGDKYIQLFDEGDRRLPDEQELHLSGGMAEYTVFKRPLATLKRFCTGVNTEYIMVHKIYTKYRYNDLLTQLLDSARICILKGFISQFIHQHNTRRFYAPSDRLDAQYRCVKRVLGNMMRNTTVEMTPCMFLTIEDFMGKNLRYTPIRDGLGHYGIDPDVEKMTKKRAKREA